MSEVYRRQPYRVLCGLCREHAVARCIRCERPVCAEHEPGRDERCAACEAEYEQQRSPAAQALARREDSTGQLVHGLSVAAAISLGIGVGIALAFSLPLAGGVAAGFVAFGPVVTARAAYNFVFRRTPRTKPAYRRTRHTRREKLRRRAFLAERRPTKLLG